MHISDDIRLGPVYIPAQSDGGPSLQELGVGPMGRVFLWDVVPVASGTALIAALQTTAGAGNLVLTAGAGTTAVALPDGTTGVRLDTPRSVTLTSAGNISGVTFTISGFDQYGQPMTQTLAGPNANTVATTKTFSIVSRVAVSGAVGTNTSVGFNDRLGLPFRVSAIPYIQSVKWDSALADDAGTAVAADLTSPATVSTGDVRGAYTPTSAANGVRRLVMTIGLPALASGPNATRVGAVGVPQV